MTRPWSGKRGKEREQALIDLFNAGLSFSEIAAKMSDDLGKNFTSKMVVGKIYNLFWSGDNRILREIVNYDNAKKRRCVLQDEEEDNILPPEWPKEKIDALYDYCSPGGRMYGKPLAILSEQINEPVAACRNKWREIYLKHKPIRGWTVF